MEEKHELKARSVNIPLALFKDKSLTSGEKFLVVIIDMLDNEHHCYASDQCLADMLDFKRQTVTNALVKLRRLGWVVPVNLNGGRRRLTTRLKKAHEALQTPLEDPTNSSIPTTNLSRTTNLDELGGPTNLSIFPYIGLNSGDESEKSEEELLRLFREFFPDFYPTPFQQDLIYQKVSDRALWRECCAYWAGNGYQPRSIDKLLDMYTRRAEEKANPITTLSAHAVQQVSPCPMCTGTLGPSSCTMGGKGGKCRW